MAENIQTCKNIDFYTPFVWFCLVLRHEICLISIQFGGVASDKTQRMDFLILFKAFDCSGCRSTWVMACLPESFKLGFGWRVRGFTLALGLTLILLIRSAVLLQKAGELKYF